MTAMMLEQVKLSGTSLRLEKGDLVLLTEATNLPQGGWFARPVDCIWRGLNELNEEYSILLNGSEFKVLNTSDKRQKETSLGYVKRIPESIIRKGTE